MTSIFIFYIWFRAATDRIICQYFNSLVITVFETQPDDRWTNGQADGRTDRQRTHSNKHSVLLFEKNTNITHFKRQIRTCY